MTEVLALEHIAIISTGPTLSLSVSSGQSLAVVGPAASGKSHFLHVIAGEERPAQGSARVHGKVASASSDGFSRRTKVQSAIPRFDTSSKGLRVNDMLYMMRLGEVRFKPISELSPGQIAACELLGPLLSDADIIVIDGQLDQLDPWTLAEVLKVIRRLQASGTSFVVATNRPELLVNFEAIIVLKEKQVRFAGSLEDLRRLGPAQSIQVSTARQQTVRALVAPFQISVESSDDGFCFSTPEGQELAAKLLLEGYGDVQYVVARSASIEEALLSLF
ncbi:MAG: ATP-binding cassette domain-containing protein [Fimbriimonas sp.]|nr:ATP-binding cassette domain-containing protein [Fimbriimonas sp.]